MKIAMPVDKEGISGPGEAAEIVIFDTDMGVETERYPNPALTAVSARGIVMIKSVIDRKVDALIVDGIGQHALDYAKGRVRIYASAGLKLEQIPTAMEQNRLQEIKQASHEGHHH